MASTTYGVLGIKVWVFKGEVLSEQAQPMPVGAAPGAGPAVGPNSSKTAQTRVEQEA